MSHLKKKIEKAFLFFGIPGKFGFLFFICGKICKLGNFASGMRHHWLLVGVVANTYALDLGPSGVFKSPWFGHSKILESKLQKTQKSKKSKNVSSNEGVVLEAWRPCLRHDDHAKSMLTISKAMRPCQRHRDRNKGIVSSEVSMLDKKVNRQRDRQPDRYRVTDRQTDRQIIVKRYTYEKFVSFEGSGHL